MTLLQEGNFKEIFKTDEGNFVHNQEKLGAKQEILCCKSGNSEIGAKWAFMPTAQAGDMKSGYLRIFNALARAITKDFTREFFLNKLV